MRSFRKLAINLAAASVTACLPSLPPSPPTAVQPRFDPTVFFMGRTHGEGSLDVRFGSARQLTVEGTGHNNADGAFQLDQVVTYANGTTEKRSWILRRPSAGNPNHYTATLSDATGEVSADATGNEFHLRYQIRSPRVFMEQWLYLQPDGRSVLNRAEVTVLGVPWAHLAETITRTSP